MPVRPFVFSCDAHVAEPSDLFTNQMPEHLKDYALNVAEVDGKRVLRAGETTILVTMPNFATHRTGITDSAFAEQAGDLTPTVDTTRRGARNLELRLADMDRDGIDAELVFPTLGLMLPRIDDLEAERVACEIYNDWVWGYCAPVSDRLVPAAMIPSHDLDDALAECTRTAEKGFAAFCIWGGLDNYNEPIWDPIFAYSAEQHIPIVFHTGIGDLNIRAKRNPGGALYNYSRQINDAIDIITLLVAGGVLDRHPDAHIVFAEYSAGWLWGLAERMDEVYQGHANMVSPKLSRLPSEIIRSQVHCALQNDIGSIATRQGIGVDALLFATDYPHSEGTFPFSRDLVDKMMATYPDCTTGEFVAILGGNAARLFERANLQPLVKARTQELHAS